MYPVVFHKIQPNIPNRSCAHISTLGKKLSFVVVYMLNRKPLCRLQLRRDSGIYHIRETQQSHPSLGKERSCPAFGILSI